MTPEDYIEEMWTMFESFSRLDWMVLRATHPRVGLEAYTHILWLVAQERKYLKNAA